MQIEETSFKFNFDKDFYKETYSKIFPMNNSKNSFIIIVLIFFMVIILLFELFKYHYFPLHIILIIFLLLFSLFLLNFQWYFLFMKFKDQEMWIKITKENLKVESMVGTHIYSYDKFKHYFIWKKYYYLYNELKKNPYKIMIVLPADKFTKQDMDFFENIMRENNIICKEI